MPWWASILEILSVGLLTLTVIFTALKATGKPQLKPLSLLIAGGGAVLSSLVIMLFSPARPPGAVTIVLILVGASAGVSLGFLVKFQVQGGYLNTNQGTWYMAIWSVLVLISSVLLISGAGEARAGVSIMLVSSLALTGYAYCIYMRYALSVRG